LKLIEKYVCPAQQAGFEEEGKKLKEKIKSFLEFEFKRIAYFFSFNFFSSSFPNPRLVEAGKHIFLIKLQLPAGRMDLHQGYIRLWHMQFQIDR